MVPGTKMTNLESKPRLHTGGSIIQQRYPYHVLSSFLAYRVRISINPTPRTPRGKNPSFFLPRGIYYHPSARKNAEIDQSLRLNGDHEQSFRCFRRARCCLCLSLLVSHHPMIHDRFLSVHQSSRTWILRQAISPQSLFRPLVLPGSSLAVGPVVWSFICSQSSTAQCSCLISDQ